MFAAEVDRAFRAHALAQFPQEACGFVVSGAYVPCANSAVDPENGFRIAARDWIRASRGGTIEAVAHSHIAPRHALAPTARDMEGQQRTRLPWGIVLTDGQTASGPLWFGDHSLAAPLKGRDFVPGVFDCYGLIRAYYWQVRAVRLPEFPRDAHWWTQGGDLFREGFKQAGFRQFDGKDAATGDVVLMQIHSRAPNHGGVLTESGMLILHHLERRLSREDVFGPWRGFVTHWLRYGP